MCHIHRYLLGDIFPFAGNFRRKDLMKGTTRFLNRRNIKGKLTKLLMKLAEDQHLQGLALDKLIDAALTILLNRNRSYYCNIFRTMVYTFDNLIEKLLRCDNDLPMLEQIRKSLVPLPYL